MLTLAPYDANCLPFLHALRPAEPDSLAHDLTDAARGFGSQVIVAMEDAVPCGVAGWVTFGVEAEGILYGVPVLARTEAAAKLLLCHVIEQARALGARQVRVSHFPGEDAKAEALSGLGFKPLLDMLSMERSSRDLPAVPLPSGLEQVPFEAIDWARFAALFNTVFAEVPNAPPLDAEAKRQEWAIMDREASSLWQDASGQYRAWIGVHPDGYVDEIGVDASLRGQNIAVALYRRVAEVLVPRGVSRLTTLLASTNLATLRLHEKLGFQEYSRRTVHALELAGAGSPRAAG